MTRNIHDQARELIALGGDLSDAQQNWLRAHLADCGSCRVYEESARQMVVALRSVPAAADARLVRATQMRVRFHASHLRETQERMWVVGIACLGVGLSATLSVPLLWRLFAWVGERAGLSTPLWHAGFVIFCIVPVLVASVLLLARGTHVPEAAERTRHGR